ncbi:HlyD family secretion protein [Biostraticola tofi]|uniref:HlyD family secretion protein n=1 Tax=Biostraticola tofi TaxID=466109 RepID=A0A4R3YXS2_9GAMM|nr:HlyD family secretion protein [Biostraticola tofi]
MHSGRAGLRLIDPGNMVHSSDTTGIVTITQTQPIALTFSVPQANLQTILSALHQSKTLPVTAIAEDGKTVLSEGKLNFVSNEIDSNTGSIKLKAVFDNQDDHLYPNQFVNARLQTLILTQATVLPAQAMQLSSDGAFVYVIRPDNTVERKAGANMLDQWLNNAFSQRQIATRYKTLNHYHVVMSLDANFTADPSVLDDLQVVNNQGSAVPLPAFTRLRGANTPLSVAHQGQSATSTIDFNLADDVSLDKARQVIKHAMANIGLPNTIQTGFEGTAKTFSALTATIPWLILAALAAVYIVLGMLYESYIHPLTILSTLPSAEAG